MAIVLSILALVVVASLVFLLLSRNSDALEGAIKLYNSGKTAEAKELFREAVLKNNEDIRAHYYLAQAHEKSQEIDKALFHYAEVKKLGTFGLEIDKLEVYTRVGNLYYSQGQFENALEAYLEVLQIFPDDLNSNSHVAFLALGQGAFAAAEPFISTCVKLKGEDKSFQIAYLVTMFELGKEAEAFDVIEKLRAADPDDLELAVLYITMCQRSHFRDGIDLVKSMYAKLDKDHIKMLVLRIFVYLAFRENLVEEALLFLKSRLKETEALEALHLEVLFYLTLFSLKSENYAQAEEYYHNLDDRKKNFRNIAEIELYIKMRNVEYQSTEFESFQVYYENSFRDLIPPQLLFRISGLKVKETIDLDRFWQPADEGGDIILKPEFAPVTLENALHAFGELPGENFLEFAKRAAFYLGYKSREHFAASEGNGVDLMGVRIKDKGVKAMLAFRRLADEATVSDIFLENLVSTAQERRAQKAILITNAQLTDAARTKMADLRHIEVLSETELLDLFKAVVPRAA